MRSLRDVQQFQDPEGEAAALGITAANWSLFGVVWDSSQVLAKFMEEFDIAGKRILELGCGMALSSLLINRRGGDITATDYHPEAENFLQRNTLLNNDKDIPYFRSDWENFTSEHGHFDLIIGSDVLYDHGKLQPLAKFIQGHAQPQCEVVVVDPGRIKQGRFNQQMLQYGFSRQRTEPGDSSYLEKPFGGSIFTFRR